MAAADREAGAGPETEAAVLYDVADRIATVTLNRLIRDGGTSPGPVG